MTVYMLQNLDFPNIRSLGIFSTLDLAKAAVKIDSGQWKVIGGSHLGVIPDEDSAFLINPIEVDKLY